MKKLQLLALALIISVGANAQLLVDSLGNIGIKAGDSFVTSTVSINSIGDNNYDFYLHSNKLNGMFIKNVNATYNGPSYGLRVYNTSNHRSGVSSTTYGVYSEVNNDASNGNDIAYGLFGQGGRGVKVYGAFGNILSANATSGAGICGSVNGTNPNIAGLYAGYFNGKVYVTDTIFAPCFYVPVASLPDPEPLPEPEAEPLSNSYTLTETNTGILDNLVQVKAVKYNAAAEATMAATTTETAAIPAKYGFDVTTLMEQFPGMVAMNAEGDTCVDYLSLIPVLLQAVKELQAEVVALKQNAGSTLIPFGAAKPIGTTELATTNIDATIVASLSQNTPNPFSEKTTIAFTLPQDVENAMICIYDMNGTQLEQINITERGSSSVQIDGYKLNAGMYLYSLIADGKVIDTKRMVLTK